MMLPYRSRSIWPLLLTISLATPALLAQDDVLPTSKILVVSREYTKPGKDGAVHQGVEGAYPKAFAGVKGNHYYALVSASGPSRALFFHGYDSYADWAAERMTHPSPTLSETLERTNVADGDLLASKDYSVWTKRDDLSLNPGFRVGSRVEEITQFFIRPGHSQQWEQLVKLVIDGYKKSVPSMHWGMYQMAYGTPGGAFVVIVTHKSAAELDAAETEDKKFEEAMGADGLKKLDELEAACVESRQTNLFIIDPKMSNPPEAFVKAEPEFWNPKK